MILDSIKNMDRYEELGDSFKKAFDFIKENDLKTLEEGKHEISGDDVFVMISEYQTEDKQDRRMEAHHIYADIQVIISGIETIYYAPESSGMELETEYSSDNDCVFYTSILDETRCLMEEGDFAVFYPNEFHKPCCCEKEPSMVKKAVFKIKMEQ